MTTKRTWFLRNGITQDDVEWLSNFDLIIESRVVDSLYPLHVTTVTTVNEQQDTILKIRFGSDIECIDETTYCLN